ncbi:hypothetical protein ABZ249_12120 [Nocardiopsis sp. NPDC006139]|uniref:hypothetical protein n=1 Tax=Nocardiopsis sp. NPDC006139 TaxID=3154578 RepID=UPI0033AF2267
MSTTPVTGDPTVEAVVDLTGHQQQNGRFTAPPEVARPFLDAAADRGWAVESTRARPVRGGRRGTDLPGALAAGEGRAAMTPGVPEPVAHLHPEQLQRKDPT